MRVISKPLGRPVSTGRGDAVRVTVRLSEEEARAYRLAAGDAGLTVAEWMRHAAAAAETRAAVPRREDRRAGQAPRSPHRGSPAGAALTALVVDATFSTGLLATLAAGALGPSTQAALLAALAAKTADTSGASPGLGWPAVRGG